HRLRQGWNPPQGRRRHHRRRVRRLLVRVPRVRAPSRGRQARAHLAARAVKACPHDASLRDTVELRLSDAIEIEQQRRHRSGLLRTAKKWLTNSEQSRGCSSLVPRPPQGYRRLLSG
uniref:Uncharacterized protein n=1 Tax=Aegilops tauschii subsp. strangulata TaxID=200361 RepID=A0A453HJ20_AEGTS